MGSTLPGKAPASFSDCACRAATATSTPRDTMAVLVKLVAALAVIGTAVGQGNAGVVNKLDRVVRYMVWMQEATDKKGDAIVGALEKINTNMEELKEALSKNKK